MTTARDTIAQAKFYHREHPTRPGLCLCGEEHPCPEARLVAFTEAVLALTGEMAYVTDENMRPQYAQLHVLVADITALAEQHLGERV